VLTINGVEEGRKELTLEAGESELFTFTLVKETEGKYDVAIGSNIGSFMVIPTVSGIVPTEEDKDETVKPEPKQKFNWGLIIGIICGAVVVAVLGYVVLRRRSENSR
jgi:hypothetical protein